MGSSALIMYKVVAFFACLPAICRPQPDGPTGPDGRWGEPSSIYKRSAQFYFLSGGPGPEPSYGAPAASYDAPAPAYKEPNSYSYRAPPSPTLAYGPAPGPKYVLNRR